MSDPAPGLRVRERSLWNVDRARWNAFAEDHRASVRLTTSHLTAWGAKHLFRSRVRLLEVSAGTGAGRRVAQCAVASSGATHVFLDRLAVDESDHSWSQLMDAVLRAIGPGTYQYGWVLSLDPAREDDLSAVAGVTVSSVRPIIVEAVDFAAWSGWDQYWRAISNNVRRNVKKAQTEIDGLRVEVRTGWRCLTHIPAIIQLRAAMYRRKGLPFRRAAAFVSAVGGVLSNPRQCLTGLVRSADGALAAFNGLRFAGNTYYNDGGSEAGTNGAAWLLITEMAERAFLENPQGHFIMGYVEPALHDETVGGGLLRSRRSMRVASYPSSIVSFAFTGSA